MVAGVLMLLLLLIGPSVVSVVVELVFDASWGGYIGAGLTAVLLFVLQVANADPYDMGWVGVYGGAAVLTVIPLLFALMAVLVAQTLRTGHADSTPEG